MTRDNLLHLYIENIILNSPEVKSERTDGKLIVPEQLEKDMEFPESDITVFFPTHQDFPTWKPCHVSHE